MAAPGHPPPPTPARCRAFGHDYAFRADGSTLVWTCRRGCDAGGTKRYDDPAKAASMAAALDRRDTDDLGRRAPLLGMFPLRLWRRWRGRR